MSRHHLPTDQACEVRARRDASATSAAKDEGRKYISVARHRSGEA